MATQEKGSEMPSAEHRDDHLSDSSPPSGKELRTFHTRLAELHEAVAAMVAEFEHKEPAVEGRAPERRGVEHPAAVSCQRESSVAQPAPSSPVEIPSLKQRLPFVKEFSAARGDWVAFKRQFQTNCDLAGWTEAEVMRALPAALDDTLAAFLTIPPSERATLQAFAQMAAI
ncbi:unnamed protein product [Lampetra planeri]